MTLSPSPANISVIGAGTMGRGIAQLAAARGHTVTLVDVSRDALAHARTRLETLHDRLVEKGKMTREEADDALGRILPETDLGAVRNAGLVIEAVVEDLGVKQAIFAELDAVTHSDCVLATNTSSLSVTGIASACARPERVVGMHFFNPPGLMKLVELVPGLRTDLGILNEARAILDAWGKATVIAKDTPGFIVNRVARPFYGEALRIVEEGIADPVTVDWALSSRGDFPMGPFELMDLVGTDVSLAVTESMYAASYHEPRYRPAVTQRRMVEAGWLGKKAGRGYYDYADGAVQPEPVTDAKVAEGIFIRVLALLISEAADAVHFGVASPADIDRAVTLGLNYPKGLLRWCDDLGVKQVLRWLEALQAEYGEDRYRASALLRIRQREKRRFFEGE